MNIRIHIEPMPLDTDGYCFLCNHIGCDCRTQPDASGEWRPAHKTCLRNIGFILEESTTEAVKFPHAPDALVNSPDVDRHVSKKSDAQGTVEFAILDALAGEGLRDAGEHTVKAILESLFSPSTRWAVRKYLEETDPLGGKLNWDDGLTNPDELGFLSTPGEDKDGNPDQS
jgi:hypothetical protein